MNEHKRLYRSRSDRQIAGVCGGLAQYFEVDPTIVRLAFIALALMGGPGLIIYIILAFVIQEEPDPYLSGKRKNESSSEGYVDGDYDNDSSDSGDSGSDGGGVDSD